MSAEQSPPYWVLISVLFSTQPLTPALAMCLHEAALAVYRKETTVGEVAGDLVSGKIRNLQKDVVLGTISGPVFEADIETERGSGQVRFILTRQGLALLEQAAAKPPRELMN